MGLFTSDEQIARLSRKVDSLSGQVRHLTRLVEHLARGQGVDEAVLEGFTPQEEPFWEEARRLKRAGSPIAAVKLVREHTGMGLREAKEAVDRL